MPHKTPTAHRGRICRKTPPCGVWIASCCICCASPPLLEPFIGQHFWSSSIAPGVATSTSRGESSTRYLATHQEIFTVSVHTAGKRRAARLLPLFSLWALTQRDRADIAPAIGHRRSESSPWTKRTCDRCCQRVRPCSALRIRIGGSGCGRRVWERWLRAVRVGAVLSIKVLQLCWWCSSYVSCVCARVWCCVLRRARAAVMPGVMPLQFPMGDERQQLESFQLAARRPRGWVRTQTTKRKKPPGGRPRRDRF